MVTVVLEHETFALPDGIIDLAAERIIGATQSVDRAKKIKAIRRIRNPPKEMLVGGGLGQGGADKKQAERYGETTAKAGRSHGAAEYQMGTTIEEEQEGFLFW
jgi:hypothetical protein